MHKAAQSVCCVRNNKHMHKAAQSVCCVRNNKHMHKAAQSVCCVRNNKHMHKAAQSVCCVRNNKHLPFSCLTRPLLTIKKKLLWRPRPSVTQYQWSTAVGVFMKFGTVTFQRAVFTHSWDKGTSAQWQSGVTGANESLSTCALHTWPILMKFGTGGIHACRQALWVT